MRRVGRQESNPEVYVSDVFNNVVNGYDQATGDLLIQLSGFETPLGLASDVHGNIYVADSGNQRVLVFAPGSTKPLRTLDDLGWSPTGVAVSSTGEVAVTNNVEVLGSGNYGIYPGSVAFFKKGGKHIYRWLDGPQFAYPYFCGYDSAGNLYLDAVSLGTRTEVGEVVHGARGTTIKDLKIRGIRFPGGVQVDSNGDLLVLDQYSSTIHRFALTSRHSDGTVHLKGAGSPLSFALVGNDTALYVADEQEASVVQYSYPGGNKSTQQIQVGGMPIGIAVTPWSVP
jgi:DNA-binding beta-propeller fold protein YncE